MKKGFVINKSQHHFAKGSVLIFIGMAAYNLSGYIIHFILVRNISPEKYGTVGVLLSFLAIMQIFLVKGVPVAVTKYLAEGVDGKAISVKAFILQMTAVVILSFFILVFAPVIARLLNDQGIERYLRLLCVVLIVGGIDSVYTGFFNGYRDFKKQSVHILLVSIFRVLFVSVLIHSGVGIAGVIWGFALARFGGLVYYLLQFKPLSTGVSISFRKMIHFSIPVIVSIFLFNFLTSVDVFIMKSSAVPLSNVGFYTSARTLSSLFAIVSTTISLTLLPSISKSLSLNNEAEACLYVKTSLRYIVILFVPSAIIVSLNSRELLSLLFTSEYAAADNALSILVWGWVFLQVFYVLCSIINASGRTDLPAFATGGSLIIAIVCGTSLVATYGMEGVAVAIVISGLVSCISGFVIVKKIYSLRIKYKPIIKILLASLILSAMSFIVTVDGAMLIGWCVLLFLVYMGLLFFLKVINNQDLDFVKSLCRSFYESKG